MVHFNRVLMLSAAAWMAVSSPLAAAEPSPKDIVNQAIKATGGADAIAKQKAMTWNESGTYYGQGAGMPYQAKYANQWPGKFRMEIVGVFTIVVDGDKGWVDSMGSVAEMSDEQLTEQKANHYAAWVTTLAPLKDKQFTLSAAGEGKVGDRATVDVKVSSKGHRDITLSFDKETHLLAKFETVVKSEELGGQEVKQVVTMTDYKDLGGTKMATKYVVTRDGEKFVEGEMTDVKVADKLDDATFAKP